MSLSASYHGYIVPHVSMDDPWFANDSIHTLVTMGLSPLGARQLLERAGWDINLAVDMVNKHKAEQGR